MPINTFKKKKIKIIFLNCNLNYNINRIEISNYTIK